MTCELVLKKITNEVNRFFYLFCVLHSYIFYTLVAIYVYRVNTDVLVNYEFFSNVLKNQDEIVFEQNSSFGERMERRSGINIYTKYEIMNGTFAGNVGIFSGWLFFYLLGRSRGLLCT